MSKSFGAFSRRGPDFITEALALVLSQKCSFEFKPLFSLVHETLIAGKHAGGGEEMMRLRTYEKLQFLVERGIVEKKNTEGVKTYRGLASLSSAFPVVPLIAPVTI